ncbi:hypothetical protein CCM_08377 [Cordyceps militaris CM01]|uniref:CAP22 n=1 Tax=Cordyceps militaris (strain CM01) TaxID=983644 RepID=G3JR38_CORMM|nr:uncharacterized protein CCM_08377 [Cordyceps militaris CM01]EGX88334.1 hypothetical protein CCM_08377 [Cordyceps militaris CM01]
MRHTSTIALAVAQLVLAANAVELEMDHVPAACKTICQPLGTLSDKCDVDLRSDRDRDEHHLQNQCICTNKSFAVGKIAGLCADCMHQNRNPRRDNDDHTDRDDLHQIDRLLYVCGFTSTTYNAAATSAVAGITVDATRPTDVSQLTTTIDGGWPAKGNSGGGGSSVAATSSGQSAQPTSGASHGTAPGTPVSTVTAAQTSGSRSSGASSSSTAAPTVVNAAKGVTAQAAYAVGGLVAAAYLLV